MTQVEEAIQYILEQLHPLGKERLTILQSLGRVLGENIFAPRNIPPWDNSAMDGYAVVSTCIRAPPQCLVLRFESEERWAVPACPLSRAACPPCVGRIVSSLVSW